jgi:ethanolaminephosphotransferase
MLLLVANLLIPVAILIFATGFFPYKPLLPGLATYDSVSEYGEPPEAKFDRIVFMVIDALRRCARVPAPRQHVPMEI